MKRTRSLRCPQCGGSVLERDQCNRSGLTGDFFFARKVKVQPGGFREVVGEKIDVTRFITPYLEQQRQQDENAAHQRQMYAAKMWAAEARKSAELETACEEALAHIRNSSPDYAAEILRGAIDKAQERTRRILAMPEEEAKS